MIPSVLRIALQVLAGLGIGDLMDKFVRPKVPAVYYPEPIAPGWRIPKILWIIASFVIGIMALRFIGRKFKIQLFK
jgi:uncharacterized membrane protein